LEFQVLLLEFINIMTYPTCNRIVNNCTPDEDKNAGRAKSASFHGAAHYDLSSSPTINQPPITELRSEHKLKEIEKKIGYPCTSDTCRSESIYHAEVVQITDELVGSMGECERIAPKKPLPYQP